MSGLRADGFQKLRKDSPAAWVRERIARSFPRWSHDATGIVLSGNSRPRFLECSVSRIFNGLNLFPVSEDELICFPEIIRDQVIPIISGVVNETELGELTSLELFVNLPVSGRILDELTGRENSCFRSRNEYVADYGHYRRGSQKSLVGYNKSVELVNCQGFTWDELEAYGWDNIFRIELRLRGIAQVRRILQPGSPATVEGISLEAVYALLRRHVLAYALPELSAYFPESYHQFQSQDWSRKSC